MTAYCPIHGSYLANTAGACPQCYTGIVLYPTVALNGTTAAPVPVVLLSPAMIGLSP